MQDKQQRLAARLQTAPSAQSNRHSEPGDQRSPRRDPGVRRHHPNQQREPGHDQHGQVKTPGRCGRRDRRARFCQPVVRKARNDSAADQRDQHQQGGEPEAVAQRGGGGEPECREMNQ